MHRHLCPGFWGCFSSNPFARHGLCRQLCCTKPLIDLDLCYSMPAAQPVRCRRLARRNQEGQEVPGGRVRQGCLPPLGGLAHHPGHSSRSWRDLGHLKHTEDAHVSRGPLMARDAEGTGPSTLPAARQRVQRPLTNAFRNDRGSLKQMMMMMMIS